MKRYFFLDGVPEETMRNDFGNWVRYEEAADIIRRLRLVVEEAEPLVADWHLDLKPRIRQLLDETKDI